MNKTTHQEAIEIIDMTSTVIRIYTEYKKNIELNSHLSFVDFLYIIYTNLDATDPNCSVVESVILTIEANLLDKYMYGDSEVLVSEDDSYNIDEIERITNYALKEIIHRVSNTLKESYTCYTYEAVHEDGFTLLAKKGL